MTLCQQTRQWLLQADTPNVDHCAEPAIVHHLRACSDCLQLSEELCRVESTWRRQPLPANCLSSQTAFLEKIAEPPQPAPPPMPRLPRTAILRWALAAAVLLGAAVGLWSLLPDREPHHTDVVSRLIDWNLDLSQADNVERQRLFAREESVLKTAVQKASLAQEDLMLAETLLSQADRLAKQDDDPLVHATQFTDLADRLVDRVDQAAHQASSSDMNRYVRHYRRILERGVHPAMDKAHKISLKDHDKKHRMDKLLQRHARNTQHLEALLPKAPAASHPELRRTLDVSQKRPKGWKSKGKN